MAPQKQQILVLVKTYPNPSRTYQETVCVAGVTLSSPPSWIRLYPVPFRDLPLEQQFKKFEIIEAEVERNSADFRPESFKVITDSLNVIEEIDTKDGWRRRRELIFPLLGESMCRIQKDSKDTKKSLGIFKPRMIKDLIVEKTEAEWSQGELELLSQQKLFGNNKIPLEKIPYKFRFLYQCVDPECTGHNQSFIDWEIMQLFRNLRQSHSEAEIPDKIKLRYLEEVCGPDRDPCFIVGNQMKGPVSFMVLSVFWPPKDQQERFDFS